MRRKGFILSLVRHIVFVAVGLLSAGCAMDRSAFIPPAEDPLRRHSELIMREAREEVASLRADIAKARIAMAKKEGEILDLQRQVMELRQSVEAKQAELASVRNERDHLLVAKKDIQVQLAEQSSLRRMDDASADAGTRTRLRDLELAVAASAAALLEIKRDLAQVKSSPTIKREVAQVKVAPKIKREVPRAERLVSKPITGSTQK